MTPQDQQANYVYAMREQERQRKTSSEDDTGLFEAFSGIIGLFIIFMALMSVGMPLKEHIDFDVSWQFWGFWLVELMVGLITCLLMVYLLRAAYFLIFLSAGYFLLDYFLLK